MAFIAAFPFVWLPAVAVLSAVAVWCARSLLREQGVLDIPNARSNHARPVPRGGGIGLVVVALLALTVLVPTPPPIIVPTFLLALVSFADDRKSLSARTRLMAQVMMVVGMLMTMPSLQPALWVQLPHAPLWLLSVLVPLLWVAWINAVNFMDGIDGLTGSYVALLLLGVLVVAQVGGGVPLSLLQLCGIILAACVGFLWLNWHPASIFLGDVGSVPLGFLSGYALVHLAASGWWISALILPGYYLADVGITLLLRASRGERLMEAHSCHAYQRAVRAGASHTAVVVRIAALQLGLIALAALSTAGGWWAVLCLIFAMLASLSAVLWLGGGWSALRQEPSSRTPKASTAHHGAA